MVSPRRRRRAGGPEDVFLIGEHVPENAQLMLDCGWMEPGSPVLPCAQRSFDRA